MYIGAAKRAKIKEKICTKKELRMMDKIDKEKRTIIKSCLRRCYVENYIFSSQMGSVYPVP